MASETLKVVLDSNGIDQIAAIIAHLKQRNDELTASLTAVQEVSTRQVEAVRELRHQLASSRLPATVMPSCGPYCEQCGDCLARHGEEHQRSCLAHQSVNDNLHRGGYAGAEQE